MYDKLHEPPSASDSPRIALAEIRAARDDYSRFFGDMFDQLQTLSLEMFGRHKCLEAGVTAAGKATDPKATTNVAAHIEAIDRHVGEMAGQFAELKTNLRIHNEALAHLADRMEHHFAPLLEMLHYQLRNVPLSHGPVEHRMHSPVDGCVLAEVALINHDGFAYRRE